MARPQKTGLTFYRSNTNRYQDPKIRRLLKKFRSDGIAVWDYILNEIYRMEGCFIQYDDNLVFNASDILKIEEKVVEEVIFFCLEIDLFSGAIFDKNKILTSLPIQIFYREASVVMKRKFQNIPEVIRLIQEETQIIQEETTENMEKSTQHNLTKPNITNNLFIKPENSDLKVGDLFFSINGNMVKQSVSSFFEKTFPLVMEGELMKRGMSARKSEVLEKFDEKYRFSDFQSNRHLLNSFKSCLDFIETGIETKKTPVTVRRNNSQPKGLTNWECK